MFVIDHLILVSAVLLLLGIISSKFSARLGMPVLVLFLAVGMLAGSEGIGRIAFEDYALAHAISTFALALILFDGGLRTPLVAFRLAWKPALVLATVGVLLTAVITGVAASLILGSSLLVGVLLGSIVGSTDAAAVFSILRTQGVRLRERVAATLEIESGSNDPMAVFLTVGLIHVILGDMDFGPGLALFFLQQMGIGAVAGVLVGRLGAAAINRLNLTSPGLYPVLAAVFGLLAYGAAASLGGSGFLSVYLAGILLGNTRLVFKRGILLFHDGAAWIGQIAMFVLLGLLSFPSRLLAVADQGLLVAAVLILVARPIAVIACLLPFRFDMREIAFMSWVGLKGAVPIILAIYPLLLGVPGASLLFDAVFFVVLVSAVTQGWSLPAMARKLGLQLPATPEPPLTLEVWSLRDLDGDIVEYRVADDSRAVGRRLRNLALPVDVVVALVVRDGQMIPPHGATEIRPGDHIFVVLELEAQPLVERIFARGNAEAPPFAAPMELVLRADTMIEDLDRSYGIRLHEDGSRTLEALLREAQAGAGGCEVGSSRDVGGATLVVRELSGSRIERVSLLVGPAQAPQPPAAGDGAPG